MARGSLIRAGDPLRALAALAVLAYHATHAAASATGHRDLVDAFGPVAGRVLDAGQNGIYVFFALSGFLLARPFLGGEPPALLPYLRNRVVRIVPAFWVVAAISLLWLGTRGATAREVLAIFGFAQTFAPSRASAVLGQAWTLDVELAFYVLLPVAAAAVARGRWTALAALTAGSLWLRTSHVYVDGWQHAFPAVAFAFAPGLALAGLEARGWRAPWRAAGPRRPPRAGGGGAWIAAGAVLLVALVRIPFEQAVLRGAAGAAGGGLVVAGAVLREACGRRPVLRGALLERLGRWSYGIYLIHVPLVVGLAPHVPADAPPVLAAAALLAVTLAATVPLSAALHHGVERPMSRLRSRPLSAGPAAAAPAAA